jgi:hypothetical protein
MTDLPIAHPTKWGVIERQTVGVIERRTVWALYDTQAEAETCAKAMNAGKPKPVCFVQPPLAAWAGRQD